MIEERIKKHEKMLTEWRGKHEQYREEAEKLSRDIRKAKVLGLITPIAGDPFRSDFARRWKQVEERRDFAAEAAKASQEKVEALAEAIELDHQYLREGLERERAERLERERRELEEKLEKRRKMKRRLTR